MLVLHGAWVSSETIDEGGLIFIWAEIVTKPAYIGLAEGKTPTSERHPFAADADSIRQVLGEMVTADIVEECFMLKAQLFAPSSNEGPYPSVNGNTAAKFSAERPSIKPWQIDCICIPSFLLISFMKQLAEKEDCESVILADDLVYWLKIYDWAAALVAEQKYLPGVSKFTSEGLKNPAAIWRPYLVGDMDTLAEFLEAMPQACYSVYTKNALPGNGGCQNPRTALLSFVQFMVNNIVKDALAGFTYDWTRMDPSIEKKWLQALASNEDILPDMAEKYDRLIRRLVKWSPVIEAPAGETRVCFRLEEPVAEENGPWRLTYWLQALDDLSLLIPAELIWSTSEDSFIYSNRQWTNQQQRLLTELASAGSFFEPIALSLQEACPSSTSLNLEQAYGFLASVAVVLKRAGFGVIVPNWWRNRRSTARLGVKITIDDNQPNQSFVGVNSIAAYNMEVALGGKTVDIDELQRVVALKSPLVHLQGQWVELSAENVTNALKVLKKKAAGEVSLQQVIKMSVLGAEAGGAGLSSEGLPVVGLEVRGSFKEAIGRLTGEKGLPDVEIPNTFTGVLRPYQKRGVSWLQYLRQLGLGGCLADDMGLGKTVQVIAFLLSILKINEKTKPTLIICPMSVIGNWQREFLRFAPSIRVLVHHGNERLSGDAFVAEVEKYEVVVSTYALAARDMETLSMVRWEHVILDEAQNIKNPQTKQTQSVKSFVSGQRIALTGTPMENRLSELWSIVDFINPGYLGSAAGFRQRYALPIERYRDQEKRSELAQLVQMFLLRRVKTDKAIIPDLPEKQESKVFCHLTAEQATLYGAVLESMLPQIDKADFFTRKALIAATLVKLKQICNHPANFLHDHSIIAGRSGKLLRLVEMLTELKLEDRRALIFTQYREMGQMLHKYLSDVLDEQVLFLHGGVKKAQRDEMVHSFQEDEAGPRFFILSLKAGGVGLNLTKADTVFHFDRWWNPAVENQATDRVFRIGQQKNVQVYKFICEGTIEEKIDEMIEAKQALAASVIGSGEEWLTELSTDELRKVFALRTQSMGE